MQWASEFQDIASTLAERPDLRAAMKALLAEHEIPVKVTEGGDRRDRRKQILGALFGGECSLEQAVAETEARLGRSDSPHRDDNRVFASGWARRLIHTHTSVFYSWAVLEALLAGGAPRCFVAHSSAESGTSSCARELAGRSHDAGVLRDRLIQCYVHKRPMRVPLVPNHPHCTHVASPVPR
ncbi:MAG TPA: hypothetical protein VLM79_40395 [Kofleriaceae bacterium]|nr:hypothetical protein [Kofleriaceae bacterium]